MIRGMRIVIVGAGTVGSHIAQVLSHEKHDVVLIDKRNLPELAESLDIQVVEGNGASPVVLSRSGVARADLLVAATNIDEVNMIACALAKSLGVKTTVARIRNGDYYGRPEVFEPARLGVDALINPTDAAAEEIVRILEHTWAEDMADFAGGEVEMMGTRIRNGDSLIGLSLAKLERASLKHALLVGAIVRNGETIIPRGDTVLAENDLVYFIGKRGTMEAAAFLLGHPDEGLDRVMIYGGSRVGIQVAARLAKRGIRTTLIEPDPNRAERAAEALPKTLVLKGDGTDPNLLKEESAEKADGFVACSEDEESNFLAALLARRHGAEKTVALLEKPDYLEIAREVEIHAAVSVKDATADAILRFVRKGQVHAVTTILEGAVEVFELEVPDRKELVGKPLAEMRLPENTLVGAVVRAGERSGEVEIPTGRTKLARGDTVVLFVRKDAVPAVGRLFSESRLFRS